jgi:hypothetical protein
LSTNEGEVYFALDGDNFDPNEITAFLGIEPTSVIVKGKPGSNKSSWKFSSGKIINDYIDTYDMASSLIETLEPKKELIIKAIEKFKVKARFEVVLWFTCNENISTPGIGFDEKTINFLGAVNAYIDIDTYKG